MNVTVTLLQNPIQATIALHNIAHGGMRYSFSVADGGLSADQLNVLFFELKTVEDGQTVTITGNPGAATCDQTIATAKGWTVVI